MDKFFERFSTGATALSASELSICLNEQPPRPTDCPETIQLRNTTLGRSILNFDREIPRRLVNQVKTHDSMITGDDRNARELRREMRQNAFRSTGMLSRAREITDYFPELDKLLLSDNQE